MGVINFTIWLLCLLSVQLIIISAQVNLNLNGTVINIVTVIQHPYVYKNETCLNSTNNINNRTLCYNGFCVDLLKKISEELKCNWTITHIADYGSMPKTKAAFDKWDGMIGELVAKKADMGLGAVAITEERKDVVEFSYPFDKATDSKNVTSEYAFAFQKGSNLTESFSHMVKKLINQRHIEQLKEIWWNENLDKSFNKN